MTPPTRWRPDVATIELDPRMCTMVGGGRRQSDHKLRLVALLAQEPVKDERRDETPRAKRTDAQGSVDGVAEKPGRLGWTISFRSSEFVSQNRQRFAIEPAPHADERNPYANHKPYLGREGETRGMVARGCRQ